MAIQWKIYYANGSTWTNEQSNPSNIPDRYRVVCIQQLEPVLNREIVNRWELYRWVASDGLWFGTSDEGVVDRLLHPRPVLGVLAGIRLPRAEFETFYLAAINDPDFSATQKNYDNWESPRYSNETLIG